MAEAADFQDWELLSPGAGDKPITFCDPIDAADYDYGGGGVIKHDYFALDSGNKYPKRSALDKDSEEETLADSSNPSWIDPESDHGRGDVGSPRIALPHKDFGRFWSDESSDDQKSEKDLYVEEVKAGENSSDLKVEVGDGGDGPAGKGEKRGGVPWWKLPLEMLKLSVFRMKPFWSISMAAAILGFAILGRRLYKMKQQSKSVSTLKLSLDEKKTSQVKARVARMNEAFSMVRRMPVMRAPLPASGVTPWPVVGFQ